MAEVDIERLVALAGSGKGRKKRVRNGRIGSRIAASERDTAENMELLYACANDWQQLEPRRREHERFVRYMNGQQWDDYVEDPDCPHRMIQEKELISRTGITPVTNNIIQQFVRNILGQMLSNKYQTVVQAYRSENGELVVEAAPGLEKASKVVIYTLQGHKKIRGTISAGGMLRYELAPGLYIVVCGNQREKVMI